MQREPIAMELQNAIAPEAATIDRRALYFGQSRRPRTGGGPLFGWYHSSAGALQSDCVAVLCGPIGHEYTRSHRTMRHLADRLAQQGSPALRFDYDGVGNSPGNDTEPDQIGRWKEGIRAAIEEAKRVSGRSRVCLIGVRLGGTLATLVAVDVPVDLLVLWNPCVKGRAYARELQAIALSAARGTDDSHGGIEAAGFTMCADTMETLRHLDLTKITPSVRQRAFVLGRDDLATEPALPDRLAAAGIPTDYARLPGWHGMMADHQFTVPPAVALAAIAEWVSNHGELRIGKPSAPAPPSLAESIAAPAGDAAQTLVEEQACRFGEDQHLFGILSRTSASTDPPIVVMLNAGAIHHVGPNRLYVNLARRLAAKGIPSLRMDLEGLGDSIRRSDGRENHPYPPHAVADTRAAIEHLRERFGYRRFVLLGLCSGAHTAFHAALQLDEEPIEELMLINPWYFYWVEGMSLDTSRHFEDVAAYRKSMRDPERWKKLLRGKVDFLRLAKVGFTQCRAIAQSRYRAAREWLMPSTGSRLSQDLRKLMAARRRVTVIVSDGDPGREILMHEAKRTVSQALKSGQMRLQTIAGTDHTFSQGKPRAELIERLVAHLAGKRG
jgi:alpha-beta hydrolase superfamily lysophospholipase